MTGQLALLDARECGFDHRSWEVAAEGVIDRHIENAADADPDYVSPLYVLKEVSQEYGVRLQYNEITLVWDSICNLSHVRTSEGYGDYAPFDPLVDMIRPIIEDQANEIIDRERQNEGEQ